MERVGVSATKTNKKKQRADETWGVKASCCQISAQGLRIDMVSKSQTLQDPMAEKDQHPWGNPNCCALSTLSVLFSKYEN